MKPNDTQQARRRWAARLLRICVCFAAALLLALSARYYVACLPESRVFSPRGVSASPRPADTSLTRRLNSAVREDFLALPGFGEKLADAIVEYRAQIGGFRYAEEIMNVHGIGEKRFAQLRAQWETPAL